MAGHPLVVVIDNDDLPVSVSLVGGDVKVDTATWGGVGVGAAEETRAAISLCQQRWGLWAPREERRAQVSLVSIEGGRRAGLTLGCCLKLARINYKQQRKNQSFNTLLPSRVN